MTEVEWLNCTAPEAMIRFLDNHFPEVEDEDPAVWFVGRKLRLFAVACCRHIEHLLTDSRSRKALEVIERYVDGMARSTERRQASVHAGAVVGDLEGVIDGRFQAAWAASSAIDDVFDEPTDCCEAAKVAAAASRSKSSEETYQAALLRDVFGNPYRPLNLRPEWLVWASGTVVKMAKAIYDERAFDRLPILADALEDAGCDNADILAHLRGPGPHVRGCWVVDLILSKGCNQ